MPSANVAISHSQTMTTATNVNTLHLTPEKCAVKNIHLNTLKCERMRLTLLSFSLNSVCKALSVKKDKI